jgi:hypothetical protein
MVAANMVAAATTVAGVAAAAAGGVATVNTVATAGTAVAAAGTMAAAGTVTAASTAAATRTAAAGWRGGSWRGGGDDSGGGDDGGDGGSSCDGHGSDGWYGCGVMAAAVAEAPAVRVCVWWEEGTCVWLSDRCVRMCGYGVFESRRLTCSPPLAQRRATLLTMARRTARHWQSGGAPWWRVEGRLNTTLWQAANSASSRSSSAHTSSQALFLCIWRTGKRLRLERLRGFEPPSSCLTAAARRTAALQQVGQRVDGGNQRLAEAKFGPIST